ncbi:hypothetical protein PCE01_18510 [Pediococcus cellicola]|nr:hypothetical protein PCE01_18510 [Pediococcus cellicola]
MVETLVVLGIATLLISTSGLSFKKTIAWQQEQAFWSNFDTEWKQYERFANLDGTITYITFNHKSGTVSFNPLKVFHKDAHSVKIPDSLQLYSDHEVKIGSDGYVKPQTISFHSDRDDSIYRLTIQLGWGVYHVKKE